MDDETTIAGNTPDTLRIAPAGENAMKKTLTRDEQIELMKTAEERHSALVKRVLKDPLVREVVSEPAPTQFQSAYTRTSEVYRKLA